MRLTRRCGWRGATVLPPRGSLSDVADHAALMHVARQRVLAAPRTLARPKVLDLKIKSDCVRFGICFRKRLKIIKKIRRVPPRRHIIHGASYRGHGVTAPIPPRDVPSKVLVAG